MEGLLEDLALVAAFDEDGMQCPEEIIARAQAARHRRVEAIDDRTRADRDSGLA